VKICALGKLIKKGMKSQWSGFDGGLVRAGYAGLVGRLCAGSYDEQGE